LVDLALFGTANDLKEQLAKGAKINQRNCYERSALLQAISILGDSPRRNSNVMFLLNEGADPNLSGKTTFGRTFPLHSAIYYTSLNFNAPDKRDTSNEEQLLQQLIKKGTRLSEPDDKGQTPIHIAALYNNLYTLRLLLSSGAPVEPLDKSGKTPLDYAKSADVVTLLKQYGAKEK
jgi:ankyrin repeat protein